MRTTKLMKRVVGISLTRRTHLGQYSPGLAKRTPVILDTGLLKSLMPVFEWIRICGEIQQTKDREVRERLALEGTGETNK